MKSVFYNVKAPKDLNFFSCDFFRVSFSVGNTCERNKLYQSLCVTRCVAKKKSQTFNVNFGLREEIRNMRRKKNHFSFSWKKLWGKWTLENIWSGELSLFSVIIKLCCRLECKRREREWFNEVWAVISRESDLNEEHIEYLCRNPHKHFTLALR